MGSLPQPYEGDQKLARTFLDQLVHYFQANAQVPGLNSAIHKVSIALTLFQGQQTAAWVRDMGTWIDSLDCKAPKGFKGLDLSKGSCGEVPSFAQGVPS
jgi:hypothetical protein